MRKSILTVLSTIRAPKTVAADHKIRYGFLMKQNHFKAVAFAKNILPNEKGLLEVLCLLKAENDFVERGYPNLFTYCVGALKLSESQAGYYKQIVDKSVVVPRLAEAFVNGDLSISKARRIASVVTPENCDAWIGKANEMKQYELEKAVTQVNPKARIREGVQPVTPELSKLVMVLSTETEALLRQVKELECQRTKSATSCDEIMNAMANQYLQENCPLRKAKRASSRKKKLATNPKPGRQPLPASLKHQIHLRDNFQCTAANPQGSRCDQKRWFEIDHVVTVAAGGLNTLENLRTLCSFHHQLRHRSETAALINLAPIAEQRFECSQHRVEGLLF